MALPELMAEARAEQALIAAQLRALKGEGEFSQVPANVTKFGDLSPLQGSPSGFEAAGPEELGALRAHVAELDHEIVQRDCLVEELQQKLRHVEDALAKALLSPAEGGLWKERYQTAQKENEVRGREVNELKLKMDVKEKEIKLLSQYVRKLEEEARIRDGQRERLLTDASIARSKVKQTESEQSQLVSRLHSLEDSFARCVGRVTQALAAGVVGVCLDEAQPVPRFVTLTPRPGSALLEIFEEPDSHWELAAVELSPLGAGKRPPVSLDENALSLVTCGVSGGGIAVQEVASPALKCPDKASFTKWCAAFRHLGLLPGYGAVSVSLPSPTSPTPTSPRECAALEQKDDALTETRLNSLLAAVEGNVAGEQRLEQRLMTRSCVVVLRAHLSGECKEHLLLLCYLRASYAVAAWQEGIHWVNSHGSLMYLYCDSAILGMRLALGMQRLVFEFPDWVADGLEKDLEGVSTAFAISAGMEVGPVLPLRGDLFGEAFDTARRLAAAAAPGELLLSSGACAAGLEDLELRKLRDAGCIELSQKTLEGTSCICAEVPDTAKLSIPIARADLPSFEASVELIGRPDVHSMNFFIVAFYARSVGVESRAYRKPMQTLRLLLKFRDTVGLAVGRAQGQLCWYQGHRVAALFERSEAAVSCADEAQKEMALHNATRKGDFQLGMVCGLDFGEVWRSGKDVSGLALWRALSLVEAGKLGEVLVTKEAMATEDWSKTEPHVKLSEPRQCVGEAQDYINFSAVTVLAMPAMASS